jgi:asparagine synthase (glutamine-hydrolysing)
MSAPYLAMSWPCDSLALGEAAEAAGAALAEAGWGLAASLPGLRLWRRGDRPVVFDSAPSRSGVILGRWIGGAGAGDPWRAACDADPAETRARALCRHGWGAYVALLRDPGDGPWWAFRDPSGAFEAFTWTVGGLGIVSSGIELVPTGLRPGRMGLDWRAIADFVRRPVSQTGRTALQDLHDLAPGDVQPIGGPQEAARRIWRPADWLPARRDIDADWRPRLAETMQSTIAGLVGPYGRVVTEVSGGLDSSIVSAGIARAGLASRVVAALHYVGDRREADERSWAAALCDRWDLPLLCAPREGDPFDAELDFAALARDVRPPYAALDPAGDRDMAARLRATRADALVTGKGGDALFFQMPTPHVLSDLWRAGGLGAATHRRNGEVARWLRRSVWSVWREAAGPLPQSIDAPAVGRFAGWALRELPSGAAHPWLADLADAPLGKQLQIRALTGTHMAVGNNRRSRAADLVQPLLAQPMMELCLSIPSWELVRGGRDRGLAREAFADWLPDMVAQRRSKGALTSHYARLAAADIPALREHLLDGVLASAGLLDRAEMEAALNTDDLIWKTDVLDLSGAAAVESWVRYWQTRVPDAAGAKRYQP